MKFRAYVQDEGTAEATWFVYVEASSGSVYACRFGQREHAERVAAAMNRAWAAEGRLSYRDPL